MPSKYVRHRSGKGWIRVGWPTAAQSLEDSLKYNRVVSVTSVNHRSEQRNQKPEEQEGEDPESTNSESR